MNAVDTNVFLYSLDRRHAAKQLKAQLLLSQLLANQSPTVMPWQVLGEAVRQLRRWMEIGLISTVEFRGYVRQIRATFPLTLPTSTVLDHALDLADRYSLSHWDSMLLGACKDAGVTTLYTEDMGAPRTIDQIQLINPLI